MAIQVESPAQITEFSAVFRRRRWWFFVPVLLSVGIGALLATLLPKKYEVDTQVKLIEVQYDSKEYFQTRGEQGALRRDLENAETEIKEPSRIHRIITEMGWIDYSELDALGREEFVEKVQENLTVEVVPKAKDIGSDFVDLAYMDIDAERAELFLERLTKAWVEELFRRDQRQISDKRDAERARGREIKARIDKTRDELYGLIARHDLAFDPRSRSRERISGDPISNRIDARESELAELEVDAEKLRKELALVIDEQLGLQEFILARNIEEGVSNDDGLLGDIQLQISSIQEQLDNLRPQNPTFQELQQQLRQLKAAESERLGVSAAQEVVQSVPNPAYAPLQERREEIERNLAILETARETLEKQQAVDRQLQETRIDMSRQVEQKEATIASDLDVYQDVEAAIASYESSLNMLNKLGASYEITKEPLAPEDPSFPNVPLVIIGAIMFGALIGGGLLAGREFLVGGFRTPADAASEMTVPILGIVDALTTRRERVGRAVLASATATATVLFLGLVFWFLWAYQERPELLGTELVERIEDIRYSLR